MHALIRAFLCLSLWAGHWALAQAADDFLPPEQAFKVHARWLAPDSVQVAVDIAPGYYVYREPLRISAQGAKLGDALVPAGKTKFDENFQKNVETYRERLLVVQPLAPGAGPLTLTVVVQGCADAGLCYPPMSTSVALQPFRAGQGPAEVGAAGAVSSAQGWLESASVDQVLAAGRLWQVALAFFGMGVLLSLTPCVLPMLPILSALILGSGQQSSRSRGFLLALGYALGMALVYTSLGVAAGLAGEGFAAALQTPWAIAGFALLLLLLSLSMFDLYELRLPAAWTTHLASQSNRLPAGQLAGVVLMGGVSALMVSPCVTAPLAGALLYISRTGDVLLGASALFAMACGMSLPLLTLGASAGRWVPRAGAWMHGVKRLFGLMMVGLALWVAQPILPQAATMGLAGLLLLLTGFLLAPFSRRHQPRHVLRQGMLRALGLLALLAGSAQLLGALSGGQDLLRPLAHLGGRAAPNGIAPPYQRVSSVAELEAALQAAAGRPVMLDFYADWCVSCKEMESLTLSHPDILPRLAPALLLKADVTASTAEHRAMLKRFGLFGPPGTLFFDTQGRELAKARVVGFQNARRFGQTLQAAGL
jgi:thioredoxin:protein disulfide reductase